MEKKISGEVYVAIAMALCLCQQDEGPHDVESAVLTFNRKATDTPWGSKILTLRQIPTVKK